MQNIKMTLIVLTILVVSSLAVAKDQQPVQPIDPKAMMDLYAKLAAPGEPHKLFASLAGHWTTNTKEWMEPGKPPMVSSGSVEMKMLLDGRYLQQEFTGSMMGKPYSGIGIDAYDNIRKVYITTWMDIMSTGIFIMEGTASADGKTITLNGQHAEPGGGYMTHRAIWTIGDNTQTFVMYGTHHGGKEIKMMEIIYSRK